MGFAQFGQAWCGGLSSPHALFGHGDRVGAVAFHIDRRERVLERDIFRFGTATSVPLLFVVRRPRVGGQRRQRLECRPPGVDLLVMVLRVVLEPRPALGAQARAVVPAHRLERQARKHCVPEHRLEVDHLVLDEVLLILVGLGVGVALAAIALMGTEVSVFANEMTPLATPGHAPDHVAFYWPAAAAVFCGDLMMGGLETAVVAAPEGDAVDDRHARP